MKLRDAPSDGAATENEIGAQLYIAPNHLTEGRFWPNQLLAPAFAAFFAAFATALIASFTASRWRLASSSR